MYKIVEKSLMKIVEIRCYLADVHTVENFNVFENPFYRYVCRPPMQNGILIS